MTDQNTLFHHSKQTAFSYLNTFRSLEALELLTGLRETDRVSPEVMFAMAIGLVRLNRITEADALITMLLELYPGHPSATLFHDEVRQLVSSLRPVVLGSRFNYGHNFYGNVILTPRTLAHYASSPELWRDLLSFHHLLATDTYTDYLDAFYRESFKRFGHHWFYLDIVNVLFAASNMLHPQTYLEIGVRRGRSLCTVVRGWSKVDIVGCDLWMENYAGMENPGPAFVRSELEKHNHTGNITLLTGDSHQILPQYFQQNPHQRFDLVTVDGDHSETGAFADLCVVIPYLAPGGIIVFDDIAHPAHPYLLDVWRRTMRQFPFLVSYEYTDCGYGVAFALHRGTC